MVKHKKVNFSIPNQVDDYLTKAKESTGYKKSQILSLLVLRYGDKLLKDLSKSAKKGEALQ